MRQFISSEFPDKQGLLCITGKDFRYLRQVLRLKTGDMLAVRMPDGTLQNTTVCQSEENSKRILLQVCGAAQNSSENTNVTRGVKASEIQDSAFDVEYTLFQYVAKPSKMEQIVRQAVECGVKFVVPVVGEYSQKQNVLALEKSKSERIERIVREARQQSGSPVQTEVLKPLSTSQAVEYWKNSVLQIEGSQENCKALVLWERNENTKSFCEIFGQTQIKNLKKIAIAVGCEGGISPQEMDVLSSGGFFPIHFNGNILRCETAALYGIAAVQQAVQIFSQRNEQSSEINQ